MYGKLATLLGHAPAPTFQAARELLFNAFQEIVPVVIPAAWFPRTIIELNFNAGPPVFVTITSKSAVLAVEPTHTKSTVTACEFAA